MVEIQETLGFAPAVPLARLTDPTTSFDAASVLEPGNAYLVAAIRATVRKYGPQTSYEIADRVTATHGDRWQRDSIRSACARAGLVKLEGAGRSPSGRRACWYDLPL